MEKSFISLKIKELKDLHIFHQIFNEIEGRKTKINRILDFLWINSSQNRLLNEFKQIKKRLPIQYNLFLENDQHPEKIRELFESMPKKIEIFKINFSGKLIGENEIKELLYICQIFHNLKYIKINLYDSHVDASFYKVFSVILQRMNKLKIDFSHNQISAKNLKILFQESNLYQLNLYLQNLNFNDKIIKKVFTKQNFPNLKILLLDVINVNFCQESDFLTLLTEISQLNLYKLTFKTNSVWLNEDNFYEFCQQISNSLTDLLSLKLVANVKQCFQTQNNDASQIKAVNSYCYNVLKTLFSLKYLTKFHIDLQSTFLYEDCDDFFKILSKLMKKKQRVLMIAYAMNRKLYPKTFARKQIIEEILEKFLE